MDNDPNIKFTPLTIVCIDCGQPFILSPTEREFYLRKLLKEPKRCEACRKIRKTEKGNRI